MQYLSLCHLPLLKQGKFVLYPSFSLLCSPPTFSFFLSLCLQIERHNRLYDVFNSLYDIYIISYTYAQSDMAISLVVISIICIYFSFPTYETFQNVHAKDRLNTFLFLLNCLRVTTLNACFLNEMLIFSQKQILSKEVNRRHQ